MCNGIGMELEEISSLEKTEIVQDLHEIVEALKIGQLAAAETLCARFIKTGYRAKFGRYSMANVGVLPQAAFHNAIVFKSDEEAPVVAEHLLQDLIDRTHIEAYRRGIESEDLTFELVGAIDIKLVMTTDSRYLMSVKARWNFGWERPIQRP
jgi:hypothetical protein